MSYSWHFQSITNQLNMHRLKTFSGRFKTTFKHELANSTCIDLKHAEVISKATFKYKLTKLACIDFRNS